MARVTVVGDALLDRDVEGTVDRVCPDAPAPVVDVQHDRSRPGGAALAAALLARDGADVTLVTAVGEDGAGERLVGLLALQGVRVVRLPTAGRTREKIRVRAGGTSLVRLDRGSPCPPDGLVPEASRAVMGADAVLVCDYAGGVAGDVAVRGLLIGARGPGRPLVWDPHVRGSAPVPGCTLVTPNMSEAAALSGVQAGGLDGLPLVRAQADELVARWRAAAVAVTMGGAGALLSFGEGAPLVVAPPSRASGDTCGAGDRFAATASRLLAEGRLLSESVAGGVAEAAAFVADGAASAIDGDVVVDLRVAASEEERVRKVQEAGGRVVATGGCFDLLHAGHVALLEAARALGDRLVVCVNSDRSVRRLKGEGRPVVAEADRVRVLESLACVDAVVVFDEDTPEVVLRRLRPDVWAKGGDYALADLPEAAVLEEWGGQAVVLPYLDGRSTTGLITRLAHEE